MEKHIQEMIDICLDGIRNLRQSSDLHHGDVMHLIGYAAALMHSRAITIYQWEEIKIKREEAHAYYMENAK